MATKSKAKSRRPPRKNHPDLPKPDQQRKFDLFLDALLRGTTFPAAAQAAGASPATARAWATKAWQHPYVQRQYRALLDSLSEEKIVQRKEVVLGLLGEARNYDSDATHGGRIRAWMGVAKVMDYMPKPDGPVIGAGTGVMLVPMMPMSHDAWEKVAREHQDNLKNQMENCDAEER